MRYPKTALGAGTLPASKAGKLEEARKLLGEVAAGDDDSADVARKMLGIKGAKKAEDPEPEEEEHREPDGDEGSDSADDAAAEDDSAQADAASAESEEEPDGDEQDKAAAEAAKATKAEADAAKCEDDARKAEDATDEALSRGDSKAAIKHRNAAKAARARAGALRSQAAIYRSNAGVHESLATVVGRFKASVAAPKPNAKSKLLGAIAANGARGTAVPPKGGKPAPTAAAVAGRKTIDEVDPSILEAAGIRRPVSSDALVRYDTVGMSIGARLASPKAARDFLAAQAAAGKGGV